MGKLITLTHVLRGPMRVSIAEDATWWARGERHWTDDDSDGVIYDEDSFEESREQIDRLLQTEAV